VSPLIRSVFLMRMEHNRWTLDLSEMYAKAINEIRREYYKEGDQLIALTRELFQAVDGEFDLRWAKKRDNASLVRDWEGP